MKPGKPSRIRPVRHLWSARPCLERLEDRCQPGSLWKDPLGWSLLEPINGLVSAGNPEPGPAPATALCAVGIDSLLPQQLLPGPEAQPTASPSRAPFSLPS